MLTQLPKKQGQMLNRFGLAIGLLFFCWQTTFGQVSISSTTPVTENFDAMNTTTTLPSNWKVTGSFTLAATAATAGGASTVTVASTATLLNGMGVSGTNIPVGTTITVTSGTQFTLSAATTSTGIANAATLLFTNAVTPTWSNAQNQGVVGLATNAGNATGRAYNYRDSTTTTDRAVGFQGGASYASPMSLMVNYKNTNTATINSLSISYKAERYRINTTAASVDFYYSTDGNSWTAVSAANVLTTDLPTGTAKYTFKAPTQTVVNKTASITGLSIPNNGNIYIRWNFTLSTTNSQGIAIDDISTTAGFAACVAPATQATSLSFPSAGTGQISGSFTAASGGADGYLVVRYPNGGSPSNPSNLTVYTAGTALGAGTVVYAGAATSFTATGLSISTSYDFYVYSYNATSCVGGPIYNTTSPLIATKSTNGCPTFLATVQIDPSLTRTDGSIYNNLTDALNDISGCPVTQATIFQLNSGYVSTSESFPLVLGAISGMSAANTITIRPASGASNLSISGSKNGNGIININAGTYWRLDGRAGGTGTTQNLTVENTDNTLAGSTAITFINGAQNNIVRYCKLRSSNIGAASGCVTFSTSSTSGNHSNTITNCDVFNSSTGNLPNVGISSVGSAGFPNDNNTISNNNIYDFFNATGNSYGIYISDNTTNWTISGNSIYETAARTLTSGTDRNWAGIGISPTTASTVSGLVISSNFIGGSAASCGGSAMSLADNGTGNIVLRGIFAQVGTSVATSIQGNTIKNISISSSSTSANQSLISAVTGAIDILGNFLGSATGTGSVSLTQTTSSTAPRLSGIIAGVGTPGSMTISNNSIGSLSASTSGAATIAVAGIYATGAASTYTISNNNIGSASTANSIQNNTTGDTWGIYLASSTLSNIIISNTISNMNSGTGRMISIRTDGGANTISGNTIRNNISASAGLTGNIGIWQASTTAGQTISGNTIHSLSNTDASAAAVVQGIYYTGPTTGTNLIEKNFVHSFSLATSSTTAAMYGIRVLTGAFPVAVQNNMVRLGVDAAGTGISTGYAIFGMLNSSSGTIAHYHNTVYIGGTSVSGTTSNTAAFASTGTINTRAFQNNIWFNARNGGVTGKHYAAQIGGTIANPTGLTNNNNLYLANGSNGFLVLYNGIDRDDLVSIRTATGQDGSSVSCDPKLQAPTGTAATVDLHIQVSPAVTQVEGNGVAIGGLTDDFDGQTRSSLTPNDIGADAGNFTAFVNPTVGTNSPVCLNGTLNLTVSPNASMSSPTYAWTGNGTFTASATVQNPSVSTGLVAGSSDYTVTITDANGCVSISTASVVVSSLPTVGSSASANTICTGSQVTLNGSGAVSYTWDNGVTNNVAFTPSGTTTFTVTGTDANGCSNTATETVTLSPAPSLGAITQATVCSGNIATFELTGLLPSATFTVTFTVNGIAQAPFTGLVSNSSGEASFNSPVALTTANNGQVLAITSLTRTDATPSCSNSFSTGNSVSLSVNPNPTITSVTQTGNSCDGQFSTINLSGLLSNSLFSFDYSIGGVAQTPGFGGTAAGTSTSFPIQALLANDGQSLEITNITITSSSPNCSLNPSSGNAVNLYVNPRPSVKIDANDFVCLNQTVNINFDVTNASSWSMGYSTGVSTVSEAAATALVNGALTSQGLHSNPYTTSYSPTSKEWKKYLITSLTNTITGCTALTSGLDSLTIEAPDPCFVTWNGSASSDWNDGNNWTPNNGAPSNRTSVVIPGGTPNQPNLNNGTPVCASLTLANGAQPQIASGFQLNVRGDLTGNTGPYFGGNGKVALTGTGLQTISGTVRLTNVDFANTSASGVVISPGATLSIEPTGTATFLANSKLTNSGNFVLASSAAGTARIAAIPTTANITSGVITMERWLPNAASAAGSWYMMSTPFSGNNFTELSDDFKVSGLSSGFGTQGGDILPVTQPERNTVFAYNEPQNNVRLDTAQKNGWIAPANGNMAPGTGYRVYVDYYSNALHKFDTKGSLVRNDFTFPSLSRTVNTVCSPATYNCDLGLTGWNLLGNPYPSPIDWDAASGWTIPGNLQAGFWRYNGVLGYGSYVTGLGWTGASPAPANPSVIPSSQGFFVRLATGTTGSLLVKESAKTASSGAYLRTSTSTTSKLKINLNKPELNGSYYYSGVVRFMEEATDGFDPMLDFSNLASQNFSFSFPVANTQLMVNSMGALNEQKIVPITTNFMGSSGIYSFSFNDLSTFDSGVEVYLRDKFFNTIESVVENAEISFEVNASTMTMSDRFELVFNPVAITGVKGLAQGQFFGIHPNPSNGNRVTLAVSGVSDQDATVTVIDMVGKVVFTSSMNLSGNKLNEKEFDFRLPSGVYTVKFNSRHNSFMEKMVIR